MEVLVGSPLAVGFSGSPLHARPASAKEGHELEETGRQRLLGGMLEKMWMGL